MLRHDRFHSGAIFLVCALTQLADWFLISSSIMELATCYRGFQEPAFAGSSGDGILTESCSKPPGIFSRGRRVIGDEVANVPCDQNIDQ